MRRRSSVANQKPQKRRAQKRPCRNGKRFTVLTFGLASVARVCFCGPARSSAAGSAANVPPRQGPGARPDICAPARSASRPDGRQSGMPRTCSCRSRVGSVSQSGAEPLKFVSIGYIAQWSERLTADQQVPGSNPGVPSLAVRTAVLRSVPRRCVVRREFVCYRWHLRFNGSQLHCCAGAS